MSNIGAIILAAGESSRFGQPKQLIEFRGSSLLRGVLKAVEQAGCSPIVVVLGSDCEQIRREFRDTSAKLVENKNWRRGIGSSIRTGVQYLIDKEKEGRFPNRSTAVGKPPLLESVVLLVCDQPFVDPQVIGELISRQAETRKPIVASVYSGTMGVPAIFARPCFEELLALRDENGAKPVILADPGRVAEFPFPAGSTDIDTPADYKNLTASDAGKSNCRRSL